MGGILQMHKRGSDLQKNEVFWQFEEMAF